MAPSTLLAHICNFFVIVVNATLELTKQRIVRLLMYAIVVDPRIRGNLVKILVPMVIWGSPLDSQLLFAIVLFRFGEDH